jgi:hypothetical protein
MQSINIAKLLAHYDSTDTSLHNQHDAAAYTQLSKPSIKAYTARAIQLAWITPVEEGYALTDQGRDLINWVRHGEERAYI